MRHVTLGLEDDSGNLERRDEVSDSISNNGWQIVKPKECVPMENRIKGTVQKVWDKETSVCWGELT